jgi:hypothetical protein
VNVEVGTNISEVFVEADHPRRPKHAGSLSQAVRIVSVAPKRKLFSAPRPVYNTSKMFQVEVMSLDGNAVQVHFLMFSVTEIPLLFQL